METVQATTVKAIDIAEDRLLSSTGFIFAKDNLCFSVCHIMRKPIPN